MDFPGREMEPRERLRQTQYCRAPSRASTVNSSHTHMTSKTSSSSSSLSPRAAPVISRSGNAHQRTNSGRILDYSSKQSPRPSKESSCEPRVSSPEVSSFLQERIERQRKVETERAFRKMSAAGDLTPSTGDIRDRDVLGSPLRCSTAMGRRSVPDTEDEDAHNKGMGLKEMEKVRTPCTL